MGILFSFDLYVISALMACESVLLLMILRDTSSLSRILQHSPPGFDGDESDVLPEMPEFRAALLDSDGYVSKRDLVGRPSLILFLSLREEWDIALTNLCTIVGAMWEKTDGNLFLACEGQENECRDVQDRCRLKDVYGDDVVMLVDSDSQLREQFRIARPLAAIMFDELGRVLKSGFLLERKERHIDTAPTSHVEQL